MDKNITVTISAKTIFQSLLILILFVGLFYVRDIVLVVITAVVIASAIEPGTRFLVKRRIPRVIAAIILYFALFIVLAGVFYILVPPVLVETSGLFGNIPQYIKITELWAPLQEAAPLFHIPNAIPVESIVANISSVISDLSGGLFETASAFLGGVLNFVLIIVISFYLSVREDGVAHFLEIVTPAKDEKYIIDLWRRTQKKIGLWMQGQLLLMLIVGILVYIALLILQIPHALLLAVFAALMELIPIFGVVISIIPAFLLGVLNGGLSIGILVIAVYLVIQQFEAHLIYPMVVKKIVGISPLLVILALVIGAKLAGLIGIILSVPLSVALVEYLDDVGKRKNAARNNLAV
jgi:predicted PurR-regulated permease PerM